MNSNENYGIRYLEENEIKGKRCDYDHPFIFISYAHDDDVAVIRRIFSELYDSGFNLWIDVANLPVNGDSWEKPAMTALASENCKLLIYFRSHISLVKDTIRRELESFTDDNSGRDANDIITVDLTARGDLHTTPFLNSLKDTDGSKYKVCEAICSIVSSHCNALRYRMDFKDFNGFLGSLIGEIHEHGFRQTFSLQQKIEYVLDGTFHVMLNPEQDKVMKLYRSLLKQCRQDPGTKRTLIISGKPGVGKSVLVMSMLNEYISSMKEEGQDPDAEDIGFLVISKNKAPRDAYKSILYSRKEACKPQKGDSPDTIEEKKKNAQRYTKLLERADKVFKGSVALVTKYGESNCVTVAITDEAHRLVEKNRFDHGYAQPDVLVNAARLSIFFLDENQMVSYEDFGTREHLKEAAEKFGSRCYVEKLRTQMRCGGADSYIDWVDALMELETGDEPSCVAKAVEYDLQVFDTPTEMYDAIVKKNAEDGPARISAGICWPWDPDGKNDNNVKDVVIGDFKKSWNLDYKGKNKSFAADEGSVEQIGSIHTVQGLEFTYAGVIFGKDIDYDPVKKELIVHDEVAKEFSEVLKGSGVLETEAEKLRKAAKKADTKEEYHELMKASEETDAECMKRKSAIIRNIYRVLLTRGTKGCYIYCEMPELQKYMKEQVALYNDSFYRE